MISHNFLFQSLTRDLYHTVWRTWHLRACSDKSWLKHQISLHHSYICSWMVRRICIMRLGVKGLIWSKINFYFHRLCLQYPCTQIPPFPTPLPPNNIANSTWPSSSSWTTPQRGVFKSLITPSKSIKPLWWTVQNHKCYNSHHFNWGLQPNFSMKMYSHLWSASYQSQCVITNTNTSKVFLNTP